MGWVGVGAPRQAAAFHGLHCRAAQRPRRPHIGPAGHIGKQHHGSTSAAPVRYLIVSCAQLGGQAVQARAQLLHLLLLAPYLHMVGWGTGTAGDASKQAGARAASAAPPARRPLPAQQRHQARQRPLLWRQRTHRLVALRQLTLERACGRGCQVGAGASWAGW